MPLKITGRRVVAASAFIACLLALAIGPLRTHRIAVATAPKSGDPPCVPGVHKTLKNTSVICNVVYDSTNPSGQTYARTIGAIFYPTSQGADDSKHRILLYGSGKAWRGDNQTPYYRFLRSGFAQQWIDAGWNVYAFSDTLAALARATGSAGEATLSISRESRINYFPNDPACMANAVPNCRMAYPYTLILDGNTPNAETVSVTSAHGNSSEETLSLNSTMRYSHAGVTAEVPTSQFPAQLCDRASLLAWLAAHAGRGAYPGNPMEISFNMQSSDAHIGLMSLFSSLHAQYLNSTPAGASWWGSSGAVCASSNAPSSNWRIGPSVFSGTIADVNFAYTHTRDPIIRPAIRAEFGCTPGTDSGCEEFIAASSPSAIASRALAPFVLLMGGGADTTAPVCASGQIWPHCTLSQFFTFQTRYDPQSIDYWVNPSGGHSCLNPPGSPFECQTRQMTFLNR